MHALAAAALRLGVPDVVDDDGAHDVGRIGEELLVTFHGNFAGLDEPKIRLVNQGRGVEHHGVARAPDTLVSQRPQLRVQDAVELVDGGAVSAGRRREDLS